MLYQLKKIYVVFVALALAASLCACGNSEWEDLDSPVIESSSAKIDKGHDALFGRWNAVFAKEEGEDLIQFDAGDCYATFNSDGSFTLILTDSTYKGTWQTGEDSMLDKLNEDSDSEFLWAGHVQLSTGADGIASVLVSDFEQYGDHQMYLELNDIMFAMFR